MADAPETTVPVAGSGAGDGEAPAPNHIYDMITAKKDAGQTWVAFEYFPPRTADGVTNLYKRIERMAKQEPLYTDCTWGAGGSTSDLTLELCVNSKAKYGVEMNMHLTCTNMPKEKIDVALAGAKKAGISNILALRGDPPLGEEKWEAVEGGFSCALDLVKYIKKEHGDYFGVSVAGYPEGHPSVITKVEDGRELTESEKTRSVTTEEGLFVCSDEAYAKELDYLKAKVDAGAQFIVTQMVFDPAVYTKFVADLREMGVTCPIVPGVMMIQSYGGFNRMIKFCKSRVPEDVLAAVKDCEGDDPKLKATGVRLGTELSQALLAAGAPGLHFYCLNLEKVTNGILKNMDLLKDPEAPLL